LRTTIFGEFRTVFISLLRKLSELRATPFDTPDLCLEIQNELFARIVDVERRIGKLRTRIRTTKSQVTKKLDKSTSKHLLGNVQRWRERIDDYQKVLHALRDIGDGLAFIYVNKWDIKPMAFKAAAGFISGKSGTALERQILEEAFKRGRIAIQNDLTNCLRYGDITIVHEGVFQVIEVKSGDVEWPRNERQKKELVKISDYLQNDEVQGLYGMDETIQRHSPHTPEVNHAAIINQLITRSYSEGNVVAEVEEGLLYHVVVDSSSDELKRAVEGREPGLAMMVNQLKFNNVGYYPFTLSLSEPDHWFDFYCGEFVLCVLVDLAVVRRKLRGAGWNVSILEDEWPPWALHLANATGAEDQPSEIKISRHFFGRLAAEFLSLEWILNESILRPSR
jgi:hypothetical protein